MAASHNSGAWSYAVPLEETDGNARPYPPQQRPESISDKQLQKRSSAWDLMSDSETTKQRRTSMRANNASTTRKRSRVQLRDKRPEEPTPPKGPRPDDSAWIHRDKLAQIEIQEMQDAGIYVRKQRRSESAGPEHEDGTPSRSASRSGPRGRPMSRTSQERQYERDQDDDYAAAYPTNHESPQKRVSTVPSAQEEESESYQYSQPRHTQESARPPVSERAPALIKPPVPDYEPNYDYDHRSPVEVAADYQQTQRQPAIRPSTSRIPVSRVSPAPVSQVAIDRDSHLPRSRAGSQNWSGTFDDMQYARKARSGSMSSQVLLDSDPDPTRTTPPELKKPAMNGENSPPKVRVPKKTSPAGRSASSTSMRPGSSHQQNKRTPSSSASRRPGSSSGHRSRPSTGLHAPEGEPPWMASMYKPDPRLPPDQQVIPTHAKRMMQEQWEKDGKTGTIYDRDFRLLNDEEPRKPKPHPLNLDHQSLQPPLGSPSPTKRDRASPNGSPRGPWPGSPTRSDTRSEHSARPGTSGGYKITPTIAQTPTLHRSAAGSPVPPTPQMPAHNPTPRVPELDEKQEAAPKKGCCCIIM